MVQPLVTVIMMTIELTPFLLAAGLLRYWWCDQSKAIRVSTEGLLVRPMYWATISDRDNDDHYADIIPPNSRITTLVVVGSIYTKAIHVFTEGLLLRPMYWVAISDSK